MKRGTASLSVVGLVLALALPSWAQVKLPTHTVTLSGTIATIDHTKRVMNIRTADDKFETVDVPQSAKRFDELKVGDKVSVTYSNDVSVKLKPPGEPAVDTGSTTSTMGQGERPGGTMAVERTMTATIDTIDKGASAITFVGPNGWKYSRHVVDPAVLEQVKVGDRVDITWNTDVTVSVDKGLAQQPAEPAPQPAELEKEVEAAGRPIYDEHCAVCHGREGKGDGVAASILTVKPADLTQLSKKNGGKYPFWQVYATIEGRQENKSHGPSDMPIWGREFRMQAGTSSQRQSEARGRILELVYYLQSLQEQ